MRILRLSLLAFAVPFVRDAWAMTEAEFQSARERLQHSQKETDRLLRNAGVVSGFGPQPDAAVSDSKKAQPLFRVHSELKSRQLKLGQLVFSKLITRLVVGSDGSPVILEIDDGQGVLSGLRALGTARQSGTAGRITVEIQRLLLRGGRSVPIQATVLDSDGSYGLTAQVLTQKAWSLAGSIASSFVSGLAASQQTQSPTAFGFMQPQATGRNAILQGVAQTAADQSKRLIDEATAEKPVFVVEAATPLTVLIQEEARF